MYDLAAQPLRQQWLAVFYVVQRLSVLLPVIYRARDLLITESVVHEWLRCVFRVDVRGKNVVQSELFWEHVLEDMLCSGALVIFLMLVKSMNMRKVVQNTPFRRKGGLRIQHAMTDEANL